MEIAVRLQLLMLGVSTKKSNSAMQWIDIDNVRSYTFTEQYDVTMMLLQVNRPEINILRSI